MSARRQAAAPVSTGLDERLGDEAGGLRIVNPGSPTDRRRQPHGTIGLLTVAEGRLIQARIVPVT